MRDKAIKQTATAIMDQYSIQFEPIAINGNPSRRDPQEALSRNIDGDYRCVGERKRFQWLSVDSPRQSEERKKMNCWGWTESYYELITVTHTSFSYVTTQSYLIIIKCAR